MMIFIWFIWKYPIQGESQSKGMLFIWTTTTKISLFFPTLPLDTHASGLVQVTAAEYPSQTGRPYGKWKHHPMAEVAKRWSQTLQVRALLMNTVWTCYPKVPGQPGWGYWAPGAQPVAAPHRNGPECRQSLQDIYFSCFGNFQCPLKIWSWNIISSLFISALQNCLTIGSTWALL